jgi:hypothetical protein
MRKKKIAHFGAFDHDSYGDLLFPLVAEAFLGSEFEVVHIARQAPARLGLMPRLLLQ